MFVTILSVFLNVRVKFKGLNIDNKYWSIEYWSLCGKKIWQLNKNTKNMHCALYTNIFSQDNSVILAFLWFSFKWKSKQKMYAYKYICLFTAVFGELKC